MSVSPSGSLLQALSNLVPQQPRPAAGIEQAPQQSTGPARKAAPDFQQHVEGVAHKPKGHEQGANQQRQHAANTSPPPPPPGRGSIINLLV